MQALIEEGVCTKEPKEVTNIALLGMVLEER